MQSSSVYALSMEYLGMTKKVIAAAYPRVSDEKLKGSTTLASQEKAIRDYCTKHGYELSDEQVYPEAMTAYMKPYYERPQFMRMIAAAKRGEFTTLVVSEYSRISRRQTEQAIIIDMLSKHGIKVESVTEAFDDSPVGVFMKNVFAFIAETERTKTLWRTARGMRDRCEDGKVLSGRGAPLYGYKWVDTEDYTRAYYELNLDVFLVNGESWTEVKVVQTIFELYLQGYSLRAIAKTLTGQSIPSRKGNPYWHAVTIRQILANESYTGKAKAFRWKLDSEKGYSVHRPDEEAIDLPEGVIPSLIDMASFQLVREKLIRNKEEAARGNKWPKDVLLRGGLVRCGLCGAVLRVRNVHGGAKMNLCLNRYLCSGKPGVAKHSVSIGAKTLDELTWEFALTHIRNFRLLRDRISELRDLSTIRVDREDVEKLITGIKRKIKNLYVLAQDATDDDTITPLKGMLYDLERQKHEAEGMLYGLEDQEIRTRELIEAIDKFETWAMGIGELLKDPTTLSTFM